MINILLLILAFILWGFGCFLFGILVSPNSEKRDKEEVIKNGTLE